MCFFLVCCFVCLVVAACHVGGEKRFLKSPVRRGCPGLVLRRWGLRRGTAGRVSSGWVSLGASAWQRGGGGGGCGGGGATGEGVRPGKGEGAGKGGLTSSGGGEEEAGEEGGGGGGGGRRRVPCSCP